MTRRRLSVLVGVLGLLAAGASLVLLLVMGSVFADARTENITGPGVDVFVRTPFPTPGSTVVLDVEARGGKRAGVRSIRVRHEGRELVSHLGAGATWGSVVRGGRSRGSDEDTITFRVPPDVRAGTSMHLAIAIAYVVALSEDGGFRNKHFDDVVSLDLEVHTASSRAWAQLGRCAVAVGCLVAWLLLVWGVAKLYAGYEPDATTSQDHDELEGIGLAMGFLGGAIVGYWLFAWRIVNALELSRAWAAPLVIVWCGAPLVWIWLWWRRRKNALQLPSARVVAR